MRSLVFLSAIVLVLPAHVFAQSRLRNPGGDMLAASQVDITIRKLMDTAEIDGLCLGIITNNRITYIRTYGHKDENKMLPIDTTTCFYAASLAKPLFACLVMQLVEEGKLALDRPLYTYLPKPIPEYKNYSDLAGDERWKRVTARHCLSHTTGFPNWRWLNPKGNNKLEFFFNPGERYAYSGEGLVLLQLAVETVTGKNLEELASKRIFQPLGMRRTSFLWQPAFESDYAVGFDSEGKALRKNKRDEANAAGSMETTIADYCRFMQGLLQGKILKPGSMQEMFGRQVTIRTKHEFPSLNNDTTLANEKIGLSYGLGWGLFTTGYGKAFFKEGHDDGWEHYTISIPGKKYSLILMTNSSNGESIFKELVEYLTGVLIPWEWELYIPYRGYVKLPVAALKPLTGLYESADMDATVTLEDGALRVESKKGELPSTRMYAVDKYHFFIKLVDADIEFIKSSEDRIERMIVVAGSDRYEMVRK